LQPPLQTCSLSSEYVCGRGLPTTSRASLDRFPHWRSWQRFPNLLAGLEGQLRGGGKERGRKGGGKGMKETKGMREETPPLPEINFWLWPWTILICYLLLWTEAAAYHGDDVDVLSRLAQAGVHHGRHLSQLPSPRPHRAAAAHRTLRLPRAEGRQEADDDQPSVTRSTQHDRDPAGRLAVPGSSGEKVAWIGWLSGSRGVWGV